jgi:hypothetical protein
MKLNLRALTVAFAVVWAGSVFITGVANSIWPGYGKSFLVVLASIYPGFSASGSFGDAIVGSLYALVLNYYDIDCRWTFFAFLDVESHLVAFIKRLESGRSNT